MNKRKYLVQTLLLLFIVLFTCVPVSAAKKTAYKSQWVRKDGNYYFYNRNSRMLRGLRRIGQKYYYFGKDGVQRTGWQKIDGRYHYFIKASKEKGCMVTGLRKIGSRYYYFDSSGAQCSGWQTVNGYHYYFRRGTKKEKYMLTGLQKLNGRTYYFDTSGVQRTGWQKIGSNYYFFQLRDKKKGYMLTSRTVNGIYLNEKGIPVTADTYYQKKLELMVTANQIMQRVTNGSMTKEQKLRACFDHIMADYGFYRFTGFSPYRGWEQKFAGDMFFNGKGTCYSYAAAFAFLANAVGYNASVVSSGGHGWAEIDGRVYDPDWEKETGGSYFNMSYDLSGVGGRPNYKGNRLYVVQI